MSTFHGLEMAKRALSAQQSGLYTTGHNISNVNTEGYSRQRVNFETDSPFPPPARNRPGMPGQIGTGVKVGTVERIRNQFLDIQYRSETSRSGFWEAKTATFNRIEGLLNEPSDSGLSKTMSQFWQSLQDLSVNPDNSGARSVVANRGVAVAETFNHLSKNLTSIRGDVKSEIDVTVKQVNSLLEGINGINEQIKKVEPHGLLANDLYDDRDRLIDKLSNIVNIKVHKHSSGGGSLDIADGQVSIEIVNSKGEGTNQFLIDNTSTIHKLSVKYDEGNNDNVQQVYIGSLYDSNGNLDSHGSTEILENMASVGSLRGLIDSYGHGDGTVVDKTSIPGMLAELDKMALEFAREFNRVHKLGKDLNGNPGGNFFLISVQPKGAAGDIRVNEQIQSKPELIAASGDGKSGSGDHALELGKVFETKLDGLDGVSVNSYFQSLIGELGVNAEEAKRRLTNTEVLRSQVQDQRQSVSGVSLDEEMTNMIKFQHAYNAAARSLTSIDELLDRIINGMGLVGR